MNRSFKGIWIPAELWLDENLTKIEVLFLTEIDSLDNEFGCFAGNEYFEKFFRLSKSRCSEIINGLKKKCYIKISYEYDGKQIIKRIIKCTKKYKTPAPLRKTEEVNSGTPSENRRPPSENTIDINTYNNTVSTSPIVEVKKTKTRTPEAQKDYDNRDIFIEHLKTKHNYEIIPDNSFNKMFFPKLKQYGIDKLLLVIDNYFADVKTNGKFAGTMDSVFYQPLRFAKYANMNKAKDINDEERIKNIMDTRKQFEGLNDTRTR